MKRLTMLLLVLFSTVSLFAQTKVIFDMDIDTDCDDAGALAILHALADDGEVDILATVVSTRYPYSAPCVEAINRYYGRPNIPIGSPKTTWADTGSRGSAYAHQISTEYVTTLNSNDDAPDAVRVYRQILADHSNVVILTVGYLTNIRDLLASGADDISPLTGIELIRQKVSRWVQTGAEYPSDYNTAVCGNYTPDPSSAHIAFRDWPEAEVPMYISGEGNDIQTGGSLPSTPTSNPVRRAYELRVGLGNTRASWDQIGVLFAVRPNDAIWTFRTTGYYYIFENGTYEWRTDMDKNHTVLEYDTGQATQLQNTIEQLMIQPPEGSSSSTNTYFTGEGVNTNLNDAANWSDGLPAGKVAVINSNGFYHGFNQTTEWLSGSTVTVGGGAVLNLHADLAVKNTVSFTVNNATIHCDDDFFCDGGNVILDAGSVTTCNDDWEANDHAGRITVNGGTHSSGPDSGMYVGAQGKADRIGCGIDFRGGTVIAGEFRFQLNSVSSVGGSAILTSAAPTTTFSDYSGNINFLSGWTGYWEVGSFSPGNWKTVLTSGGNITLDGTAIDSVRFDNSFRVSFDGTTLTGTIPECSLFMGFLTMAGLFIRRYYN